MSRNSCFTRHNKNVCVTTVWVYIVSVPISQITPTTRGLY